MTSVIINRLIIGEFSLSIISRCNTPPDSCMYYIHSCVASIHALHTFTPKLHILMRCIALIHLLSCISYVASYLLAGFILYHVSHTWPHISLPVSYPTYPNHVSSRMFRPQSKRHEQIGIKSPTSQIVLCFLVQFHSMNAYFLSVYILHNIAWEEIYQLILSSVHKGLVPLLFTSVTRLYIHVQAQIRCRRSPNKTQNFVLRYQRKPGKKI